MEWTPWLAAPEPRGLDGAEQDAIEEGTAAGAAAAIKDDDMEWTPWPAAPEPRGLEGGEAAPLPASCRRRLSTVGALKMEPFSFRWGGARGSFVSQLASDGVGVSGVGGLRRIADADVSTMRLDAEPDVLRVFVAIASPTSPMHRQCVADASSMHRRCIADAARSSDPVVVVVVSSSSS
eukprot:9492018-Pyramimonas_sp.AAC.1